MAVEVPRILDRFRQPEYIGPNRCMPCTIVNLGIAGMLAGLTVVVAGPLGVPGSIAVAGVVFVGCAAVIYLRGYLVPGTPELTQRYLPDRVLAWFEQHKGASLPPPDADPETLLKHAGVVEECADVDDLCLTTDFRDGWTAEIDRHRDADATRLDLAALLDVDPGAVSFTEHGDAVVATVDGRRVGQWESQAALIADTAAATELASHYPAWRALDVSEQGVILHSLRPFLVECPECGAPVEFDTEVTRSCCRKIDVYVAKCSGCDARLIEVEADQSS